MSLVDVGIVLFVLALAAVGYDARPDRERPAAGRLRRRRRARRPGRAGAACPTGAESPYAPLVAVLTGVLLGAFLAVALDGLGRRLRRAGSAAARSASLDGIGGAVLLAALAPAARLGLRRRRPARERRPARDLREAVQRSAILGALNDALPPSGPLLNVLRRVDPTPGRARARRRRPAARAGRSSTTPTCGPPATRAVRVLGTACGLGVEGSGWVAGARARGHQRPRRRRRGRHHGHASRAASELDATAVHYDTAQRPRAARASTGSSPRRSTSPTRAAQGHRRRRDRLPGERAASRSRRRGSGAPAR